LVLFVGRIQPLKGPDIAIRALSLLPEVAGGPPHLAIIGGPSGASGEDELASLQRLAADLGVAARTRLVRPLPHRELADWYRAADALIMPSRSESFGLVAAEAQSCGLPVVASRVGGLPSVVADSEAGILVDGLDPASFAGALRAILDHPDFAARLGQGALRWSERFSWDATADRLLELYEGITRR
ncbi:MAG: glycosyltransferase, partial [Actinobacteria bacterium]